MRRGLGLPRGGFDSINLYSVKFYWFTRINLMNEKIKINEIIFLILTNIFLNFTFKFKTIWRTCQIGNIPSSMFSSDTTHSTPPSHTKVQWASCTYLLNLTSGSSHRPKNLQAFRVNSFKQHDNHPGPQQWHQGMQPYRKIHLRGVVCVPREIFLHSFRNRD